MATQTDITRAYHEARRALQKVHQATITQDANLATLVVLAKEKLDDLAALQPGSE